MGVKLKEIVVNKVEKEKLSPTSLKKDIPKNPIPEQKELMNR